MQDLTKMTVKSDVDLRANVKEFNRRIEAQRIENDLYLAHERAKAKATIDRIKAGIRMECILSGGTGRNYCEGEMTSPAQAVTDLLADLLVYCEGERVDVDDVLRIANDHVATEREAAAL